MKKMVISVMLAGCAAGVSASDLASKDAAFLFGNADVNVAVIKGVEMVQTQGQLLEIMYPVLKLVTGLPLLGSVLGSFVSQLPMGPLMGTMYGSDVILNSTLNSLTGLLNAPLSL